MLRKKCTFKYRCSNIHSCIKYEWTADYALFPAKLTFWRGGQNKRNGDNYYLYSFVKWV